MNISRGLFDGMVIQRTGENVSDAAFAGSCKKSGLLRARVLLEEVVLPEFDNITVGQANGGKFEGRLAGLPVGGPYQVEIAIDGSLERVTIHDIYVGDVWILGGQSNMFGYAARSSALPAIPQVRACYMSDKWASAKDPIHDVWNSPDETHAIIDGIVPSYQPGFGVGSGVSFGQTMYELTGVPQGLIPCAHGGTTMVQWDPNRKKEGGRSLYGATYRRFQKNGCKIAGVIWYQGCSEAHEKEAKVYTGRMKELVAAIRRDFGDKNLPIAAAQIACVYDIDFEIDDWNSVQEQQRRFPDLFKRLSIVPTVDLEFQDSIHLDGPSQHRLGKRLAKAVLALLINDAPRYKPISLRRVSRKINGENGFVDLVLEFSNVVGSLKSAGKPSGFSLSPKEDEQLIFRITLDGNKVILHTRLQWWDIQRKELYYGYGKAPYCNITDEDDRSLPAFGPVPVGKKHAYTPFIRTMRISDPQPLTGKLNELPLLSGLSEFSLSAQTFDTDFCCIYDKWEGSSEPKVIWFSCRFSCVEQMRLSLCLGYDGPVAVWIDGKEVLYDPKGANPAVPDAKTLPFTATPGEHEVIVALSSNNGQAWGIYMRYERKDVTAKLLQQGGYAMPDMLEDVVHS